MLMTTERLRYLVEVANSGSFSAAGRNLGVSASAVNQMINNMEIDLDLSLFDRVAGKAPILTAAGKAIYFQAQELLPRLNAIELKAQSLKQGVEPSLTIALHGLTFFPRFQQVLHQLSEAYPELQINLVDSEVASLQPNPEQKLADITIAPANLEPKRGVESKIIDKINWCFVAAPTHPLAKRRGELSSADLSQYQQLLPSEGNIATPELIESLRYSPKVVSCDRLYQITELACSGMGFALYPQKLLHRELRQRLVELQVDFVEGALEWPVEICWTQSLGVAGNCLVDELTE
ncbi:LysR family transcriptional regulator [Shewanella waksmanii]|uniref:LysR family transcriptional regulator n=1 Tax=Shewanella waksmanii TaxID=213783 RepID=UPI00048C3776|nr:LysR family transcriptional regulator [Shewanella waksmanii]